MRETDSGAEPRRPRHGRRRAARGRAVRRVRSRARVVPLTRAEWDVTLPPPSRPPRGRPRPPCCGLDGRRRRGVVIRRTRPRSTSAERSTSLELGAPVVLFSTDYVFDGRKREPYVESDAPNPLSVYGRTKLQAEAAAGDDAWIVRTSWLHGWTSTNFVRTMLRLGAERDEVAVVDDQRGSPTYVGTPRGRRAGAARCSRAGCGTSPAAGDCTWAEFAEAIFEDAGLDCRVRRISAAELDRPALAARVLGAAERAARRAAAARLARRAARGPGAARRLAAVGQPGVEVVLGARTRPRRLPTG